MLPELLNIKHLFVLEAWPPLSLGLPLCALLCMHVCRCVREPRIRVHMYVGYCFNIYTYVCMHINIGVHAYMYIHVLQENLPAINRRLVNMEELMGGCFRRPGTSYCDSLHRWPFTACSQLFDFPLQFLYPEPTPTRHSRSVKLWIDNVTLMNFLLKASGLLTWTRLLLRAEKILKITLYMDMDDQLVIFLLSWPQRHSNSTLALPCNFSFKTGWKTENAWKMHPRALACLSCEVGNSWLSSYEMVIFKLVSDEVVE